MATIPFDNCASRKGAVVGTLWVTVHGGCYSYGHHIDRKFIVTI